MNQMRAFFAWPVLALALAVSVPAVSDAETVTGNVTTHVAGEGDQEPAMAPAPLIDGAFGYVLGQRWEGTATPVEPGLLKAEVSPLVDSGLFDFHSLWLDPQSRTIVQISASRAYPDPREAEQAHLTLVGLLTGKYGSPRTEQLRQVFGAQGRSVHVLMSLEGEVAILGVVYQDDRAVADVITRPRFELNLPEIPGVNASRNASGL